MKAAHIMHSSCRLLQRASKLRQVGVAAASWTSAAQASRSALQMSRTPLPLQPAVALRLFVKRCSSIDTTGAFAKRCSSIDTTPFQLPFKPYSSLTVGAGPLRAYGTANPRSMVRAKIRHRNPAAQGTSPARILEVTAAALNSYPPAWPPSHAFLGHRLIPYATVATRCDSLRGER